MSSADFGARKGGAGTGSGTTMYNPNAGTQQDSGQGGMQEKAMDKASEMRGMASEKASEYSGKLHEGADAGVNRAAEGLEKAAVQLRDRAENGGGMQEKVGVRVADSLDKTSQYLRDHEATEIWSDVERFVQQHPMQAAVGAAVAGYVVAKVLK